MEFELYEYYSGTVEKRTLLFAHPDAAAVVFTGAVTPEGEVGVYSGRTSGVVHVSASALSHVVEAWLNETRARGGDPETFSTALVVSLAIVNKASGVPLYYATYFLDYSPGKVSKGRELVYALYVVKERGAWRARVAEVDREEGAPPFGAYSLSPPYQEPPEASHCEVADPFAPTLFGACLYDVPAGLYIESKLTAPPLFFHC